MHENETGFPAALSIPKVATSIRTRNTGGSRARGSQHTHVVALMEFSSPSGPAASPMFPPSRDLPPPSSVHKSDRVSKTHRELDGRMERTKEVFERFDKNKNGSLDVNEVAVLMEELLGHAPADVDLQHAFKVAAGVDGVVDFKEFCVLVEEYETAYQKSAGGFAAEEASIDFRGEPFRKPEEPINPLLEEAGGPGWVALDGFAMRNYSMRDPVRALFLRWRGTLLPPVLSRPEVWFFAIVHTGLLIVGRVSPKIITTEEGDCEFICTMGDFIDPSVEQTTTLFTIFLLAAFNTTVYERYRTLYHLARAVERSVHLITSTICSHIDKEASRFAICRLALAAAMITFMRAVPEPGEDTASPLITESQWERMLYSEKAWLENDTPKRKEDSKMPPAKTRFVVSGRAVLVDKLSAGQMPAILTRDERALLEQMPAKYMPVRLHAWMLRAIRQEMTAHFEKDRPDFQSAYEQLCSEVKEPIDFFLNECSQITHELSLPVPLPYFHAVVLLMLINYAVLTLSLLRADTLLSPIIFILIMLVTTGLREVAAMFSNPFGTDAVDFPVHEWITEMRGVVGLMVFQSSYLKQNSVSSHLSTKRLLRENKDLFTAASSLSS